MTSEVAQWLAKATDDLNNAQYLYDNRWPRPLELICFLSQQCAEKSVKAYLISLGIEPPYTHDIVLLIELCRTHTPVFHVFSEAGKQLTPYAVRLRYPDEMEVDEPSTSYALNSAREIFNTTVSAIGE
ncbi:MAG: HEPN domain-containing protein [Oscillospiraceae bacterium]|nr:HEPN domain-containing protein [Oscillospiraceae bacterium]